MNFEYKETIDKQRELVSLQKKVVSKSLVSALKVFLYIMCLAIVTGGFFGLGVIHGIIKSAPSVENISIVPSSYSTTVYDTNNKQIAKLITSGSNRIKADLKDIPEHGLLLILRMHVFMNITVLTFRVSVVRLL